MPTAYATPLPQYDIIVFDDEYHSDEHVQLLFEHVCQLEKAEAGRKVAELRANGVVTVLTTHYERAEHYEELLEKKSSGFDVAQCGRSLYVEIKEKL